MCRARSLVGLLPLRPVLDRFPARRRAARRGGIARRDRPAHAEGSSGPAALEITTDELLQPGGPKPARKPSRKVLRRLEQIEALPSPQQSVLLKTIDTFLENAAFRAARR